MNGKSIVLSESNSWGKVKVEDGVIKGVKLLGERSKNGNRYPLATRRAAHPIFEGLHVNLNHRRKGEESGVESRIGKIVNVQEGKDGTYGDFLFIKSHPFANVVVEAAERMPELMGFSINGKGKVKTSNGETIVESIDTLRSVDLVADPATNRSLFESEDAPETKSCEQILGELIAALVAEGKEDMVKDAIKLKKKITGNGDSGAPEEAPEEEAPTEESWKEEYKTLKAEKACRALLESHKVTVEQDLVESLMSMNESAREKFVKWHKRTAVVKAPRSSEPMKLEESVKDYASILRSR